MKVNEVIFRDYDIRGIVGEDLDESFAFCFGQAFGTYLLARGSGEVLVGYDARQSSPGYYKSCIEGLISTGINVVRIGMVTSPMLYWARKFYKIDGGLAITASHNPPEYNGFKPCSGNGALFGEEIQKLKGLMISEVFAKGTGSVSNKNIYDDYYSDITSRIKLASKLSVIVDCGNATGGPFVPELISRLGASVDKLYCDVDPTFPNHPPDPVDPRAYPEILKKMKGGKYDMGLLFDGDCDRLGVVDAEGNIIRGDQITALCARKILTDKPKSKILFEVQCSKSATDDVVKHGGEAILCRVGHSYIEEALLDRGGELAGETSGHIFFADRWYGFDDALYAACRLLEYVSESGKTLKELVDSMPKFISTPTTRVYAADSQKFAIIDELKAYFRQNGYEVGEIDGARLEWPDGWAVVRASNTQPQITLRAEATTEERLSEIKKLIEKSLEPYEKDGVRVEWGKVH